MHYLLAACSREMAGIISGRTDRKSTILWTILIVTFGVFIPMSQAPYWLKETPLITVHLIMIPLIISYWYIFSGPGRKGPALGNGSPATFYGRVFAGFIVCYFPYILICYTGLLTLNYVLYMNGQWQGIYIYSAPALFAFFFCGAAAVFFGLVSGYLLTQRIPGIKHARLAGGLICTFAFLVLLSGAFKISFTWNFVLTMFLALIAADLILFKVIQKNLQYQSACEASLK